jgi:ABC-type dipeptide/oligopeptide/nickel transport system ATPase component
MIESKFKIFQKEKKIKSPFEKNSISYICGQTGTGKSSINLNILRHIQKEIDDIEEAYYFTGSKKDKMLLNLGPDIKISSDPERFNNLLTSIENEGESPRRLIVLDDLVANPMFNLNSKKFLNFILNHRHNNVTILITSQGWKELNKQIRSQASLIFCFPSRNEKQAEDQRNELPVSKEKLKKAMELIQNRGDHDFLYINIQKPTAKFFVGFDEPILF